MLSQCPPAGTPAGSADEVSDVYFVYINLERGKLISPFASSIFLSLPTHMGSLSKKSKSSKAGGFIQMLLSGKKRWKFQEAKAGPVVTYFSAGKQGSEPWWLKFRNGIRGHRKKRSLFLYFGETDGRSTVKISFPYFSLQFPV